MVEITQVFTQRIQSRTVCLQSCYVHGESGLIIPQKTQELIVIQQWTEGMVVGHSTSHVNSHTFTTDLQKTNWKASVHAWTDAFQLVFCKRLGDVGLEVRWAGG